MSVVIRVQGFEESAKRLNAFASADRRGLMEDIGDELISQILVRFEDEKDIDGRKWVEWADVTKRFVAKHAPGSHKLWRSGAGDGRLKNRMSVEATADEVVVRSDVVYAGIYQAGGRAGRGKTAKISARPYLGLSVENVEDTETIITDWIAERV